MTEGTIKFGDIYRPQRHRLGNQFLYLVIGLHSPESLTIEHHALIKRGKAYHLQEVIAHLGINTILDLYTEIGYDPAQIKSIFEDEARKPRKKF